MIMLNRRKVLRGLVNGSAVTVGLPFLNVFLNGNGNALASGEPMPVRFGTWVWGLGINRPIFVPKKAGANYELPEEVECLKPVQDKINILTDYTAYRDAYENFCHYTGWVTTRSGQAPATRSDRPGETFDVTIANKIGRTTRFKMLTVTAYGDPRTSLSYENQTSVIPPDFSPVAFYTRIFGPGFQDPNAATFTPDAEVMLRKGALSGVLNDIKDMNRYVGAEDKARLDQYFTGLRELERQLQQQLTKPDPIAACLPPAKGPQKDPVAGVEASVLAERHKLLTDLMVMAIACDQTRVFNIFYAAALSNAIKKGYDKPHHTASHEEAVDVALGYQPNTSWFTRRAMESFLYFVQAFSSFKEGDGTLLDHVLVLAHSDHGLARTHSIDGMGMFTAGRASGKVKTGLHVPANGASVSELPLTMMRVMGLDLPRWGTKSNTTSKIASDILV